MESTTNAEFTTQLSNSSDSNLPEVEIQQNFLMPKANEVILTIRQYIPFVYFPMSLIFNTLCIIVFARQLKKKYSISFYYLMIAITDLLIITVYYIAPWIQFFTIASLYSFTWFCKIRDYSSYAFRNIQAWFMVALAIERLVAVIWPHKAKVFSTKKNAVKISVAIIVGSMLLFTPALFFVDSRQVSLTEGLRWICTASGNPKWRHFVKNYWFWVDLIVASLAPCAIILIVDAAICQRVFSAFLARRFLHAGTEVDLEARKNELNRIKSMITTMLALTFTFVTLTAPFSLYHVTVGSYVAEPIGSKEYYRKQLFGETSVVLLSTNYVINFFLHLLTSKKFCLSLKELLCASCQNSRTT